MVVAEVAEWPEDVSVPTAGNVDVAATNLDPIVSWVYSNVNSNVPPVAVYCAV